MLEIANLEVVYNEVILVLRGLSIEVPEGDIVALLGANGAGKTTTVRSVSGLLDVHEGEATKGSVTWKGQDITHAKPSEIVEAGITQVMEGRRVFAELTVDENLATGGFTVQDKAKTQESYDRVMDLFPRLAERRKQRAGSLSGGERQMVAMGRALMASPRVLLMDEPSMGLAPTLVQTNFELIQQIHQEGIAIFMVEQNANMALSIADRGWVLQTGRVVLDDSADALLANPDLRASYLGEVGSA